MKPIATASDIRGAGPAALPGFSALDRHFARLMGELAAKPSDALTLAAALVSHQRAEGHTCLELASVAGELLRDVIENAEDPQVRLPALSEWTTTLRASGVVGSPGDFAPLVLDAAGRLYLHRYWRYEADLATTIRARAARTLPVDEARLDESLRRLFPATDTEFDWQRHAARTAATRALTVITGGPGTGKTRTVVWLLAALLEQAGDRPIRIALAAPTGKAAARIAESVRKAKAELPCDDALKAKLPEEATTIHRLLRTIPDSPRFRHDAANPLAVDVVVVDEASMVDLALMAKLFAALPPAARVILVGDKDQLASVEAGNVLGEICGGDRTAGPSPLAECVVELRKNWRFGTAGGIQELSRAVNAGEMDGVVMLLNAMANQSTPALAPALAPGEREKGNQPVALTGHSPASVSVPSPDTLATIPPRPRGGGEGRGEGAGRACTGALAWRTLPSPSGLMAALREIVLDGYGDALRDRDPVASLAALSRFRLLAAVRRGPFGVENLNAVCEALLERDGLIQRRGPWYAGRPVMVTRNDPSLRLFNGDVGITLPDAAGELRVFFAETDAADGVRAFAPLRLPEHETVFAMTVHKSQGSEFDRVLLVLPERDSPLLTRELIYTGLTRARSAVELWADEPVLRAAIRRRVRRASGLGEAIRGEVRPGFREGTAHR